VVGVLLLVGQVRQGDVGALTGVGDRDGGTDAGVGTGDEGLPAGEPATGVIRDWRPGSACVCGSGETFG
jgi:hypothetical protein